MERRALRNFIGLPPPLSFALCSFVLAAVGEVDCAGPRGVAMTEPVQKMNAIDCLPHTARDDSLSKLGESHANPRTFALSPLKPICVFPRI
jgi:hypothetical protein